MSGLRSPGEAQGVRRVTGRDGGDGSGGGRDGGGGMKQGMALERAERHRGRTEGRGAGEERRTKEKPPTTGGSARGEEREARSVGERLREQLKRPAQFVVRPLLVKPGKPLLPGLVTTALEVVHDRFAVLTVG